jgi:CubicO group peptidase (beta-lactamase class C family)
MKLVTVFLFAMGFAVGQCQTGTAQQSGVSELSKFETIEKAVPVLMQKNNIPGAAIAVISEGKIAWSKGFGQASAGKRVDETTLFNIASQTKPVVAAMVLKMVNQGKWKLDEPLSKYWIDPDLKGHEWLSLLTTRHVLTHRTGFPNWRNSDPSNKLRFQFKPGTSFGYSGEGFEYLAASLQKKFGMPLDSLLSKWILVPAGMHNTSYYNDRIDSSRLASWYDRNGAPYNGSQRRGISAADDLISTVDDYCRFGIYVMNGNEINATLFKQMVSSAVMNKPSYGRGLGWGVVKDLPRGEIAIEHGGSDIGVRTMAIFKPKSKSGVVIMVNSDNGQPLIDSVIKLTLNDGALILAKMNEPRVKYKKVNVPDSTLVNLSGIYREKSGRIVTVERESNYLLIEGEGIPPMRGIATTDRRFFLDGTDLLVKFEDRDTSVVMDVFEDGRKVTEFVRRGIPGRQQTLLFDLAHGQTENRIDNFRMLAADIGGINVLPWRTLISDSALAGVHSVILATPNKAFESSEIEAISSFINKGGSLLLFFDEERRTSLQTVKVNDIISSFGIELTGDAPVPHNCGAIAERSEVCADRRELPYSGGRSIKGGKVISRVYHDGDYVHSAYITTPKGGRVIVTSDAMVSIFLGSADGIRFSGTGPSDSKYWGKDSRIFMEELMRLLISEK